MTTFSATKVRQRFFKIIEEAAHPGAAITITALSIERKRQKH